MVVRGGSKLHTKEIEEKKHVIEIEMDRVYCCSFMDPLKSRPNAHIASPIASVRTKSRTITKFVYVTRERIQSKNDRPWKDIQV